MIDKCIVCGENTVQIYHERFKEIYHQCENCEFISKDSKHIVSLEEELKIYNYHNNSIEDPRYVEYFNKFIEEAIIDNIGTGRSGLDFGSGPSPVLADLLERDYSFDIDIYDPFFSPEKTYEGKTYDLITSTEVIEHLRNPITYFHLFKNLLKKEGVLAIMTQFHKKDLEHFIDWHYIRDKSHISFYTHNTLRFIAEQVGLKVIYTNREKYTVFCVD